MVLGLWKLAVTALILIYSKKNLCYQNCKKVIYTLFEDLKCKVCKLNSLIHLKFKHIEIIFSGSKTAKMHFVKFSKFSNSDADPTVSTSQKSMKCL